MGAKYEQDAIFFKSPQSSQGLVIGTKKDAWPGLDKEEGVGAPKVETTSQKIKDYWKKKINLWLRFHKMRRKYFTNSEKLS